jgi:uncharacterized protein YfiM (DUF2279 family)
MKGVLSFFLVLLTLSVSAQQEVDSLRTRKKIVAMSTLTGYSASMLGLYHLWYKDYPQSSFHFFNDNSQWLQMDKVGHLTSAYMLGSLGKRSLSWAGYSRNKSILLGGSYGLVFFASVEMLDGFSSQWGFSWGDQLANFGGTALFISQELFWNEQRMQLKFSYTNSPYANYNPAQLGRNFQQRVFKDYNAQTYWASFNVSRFLASGAEFPKWLNIAFGYGAREMIGAEINVDSVNNFQPTREFYFSFDADLNQVNWPRQWMKKTAYFLSFIKIPSPTLEVRENGTVKLHALFF